MKKSILKAYAKLIVRSGVAVRKGQDIVINGITDVADFAALVVEECYKAGAKHVVVRLNSEACDRAAIKKGKEKYLGELLPFDHEYQKWNNEVLPAYIWLDGDDPDAMKGVNQRKIAKAKMIFWNGPMGVFEQDEFQKGTLSVCEAIAKNDKAFTVCGGGDSAAAVKQFGYKDKFSHVSTGGGASLEMIENDGHLPGIDVVR